MKFSSSGLGKHLVRMIAQYKADINVIMGKREVREFLKDLGEEGLKRSIVIVA